MVDTLVGMNEELNRPSPWIAWAQLVRLPNVFTVLADVAAAFLVVAQGPVPVERFVPILIAGVALYWAGMVLNDVFDITVDQQQRSDRPLAAGRISLQTARMVGYGLLAAGVIIAGVAGQIPVSALPTTWMPALVAVTLAVMILLYNGPLKKTPLAPTAMGVCRLLSFLLGASVQLTIAGGIPSWVLTFAVGMGIYVMGVTLMGRREAVGDNAQQLLTGTAVVALGGVIIATAPTLDPDARNWHFAPGIPFALLIGMIVLPVVMRGGQAWRDPKPIAIQGAVRSGVLTIIPLAAAIAFLGAGAFWGLLVFSGVVPALALSRFLRVT